MWNYAVAGGYLGSIILGNLFVTWFGIGTLSLADTHDPTKVYFALTFPLGALWIGITFSFRDYVQNQWGHKWCVVWMLIASLITVLFNTALALASFVSFIVSEFLDWLIFLLMRKSTLAKRLIVSNLVSCPVDSILFVTIAFGLPWYSDAIWGQAIVKYTCGLFALLLIPLTRKYLTFEFK